MGRPKRAADGGLVYHVLNRANARMRIFDKPEDYEAFEVVLAETEKDRHYPCYPWGAWATRTSTSPPP